jgi:hypothetical protein
MQRQLGIRGQWGYDCQFKWECADADGDVLAGEVVFFASRGPIDGRAESTTA